MVQDLNHRIHLGGMHSSGPGMGSPQFLVVSDVSGTWGCGAFHENLWFQLQWPESWSSVTIAPKELVPIVVATTLWGPLWVGK